MKNLFSMKKEQLKKLKCPACTAILKIAPNGLSCLNCKIIYPIKKIQYNKQQIYTPILHYPVKEQPSKVNFENFMNASSMLLNVQELTPTRSAKEVYEIVILLLEKAHGFIVDNGAGNNGFRYFAKKEIFSIDFSKYGSPYYPLQLLADSNHLPFQDSSVDVFVSNFVVQEIKDKEAFFREMKRSLKEKGKIIVSFPSPFWYLAFFISPASYKTYLKKITCAPKEFLKNPLHHFLHENTHGCSEYSFLKEISIFRASEYEKIFNKLGLNVVKKLQSGNIFSLYPRYSGISGIIKNKNIKAGIHYTYLLEKQ